MDFALCHSATPDRMVPGRWYATQTVLTCQHKLWSCKTQKPHPQKRTPASYQKCWPANTAFVNRFDCLLSQPGQASSLCTTSHQPSPPPPPFYSSDTYLLSSQYKLAIVINVLLLVPSWLYFIRKEERSSPLEKKEMLLLQGDESLTAHGLQSV